MWFVRKEFQSQEDQSELSVVNNFGLDKFLLSAHFFHGQAESL